MLTEQALKTIVEENIKKSENLGEHGGESGHLGYVSYELNEINPPKAMTVQGKAGWEITYLYTVVVTTEFTYEPDNPPYQTRYQKTIVVDDQGHLLQEGSKDLKWSNLDMDVDLENMDLEDDGKK